MALVKCPECGKDVSTTAKACPHCGAEPPRTAAPPPLPTTPPAPPKKKRRLWLWLLGALVLLVIYANTREVSPEEQAAREQRRTERAAQKAEEDKREAAEDAACDEETKEMVWMERGKDAVRARLKDPKSAEFKEVYFSRGKDNVPMTCGQVNSRNSFGGFVGFQHFVSAGSEGNTFLATEVDDFAKVWNRFCTTK